MNRIVWNYENYGKYKQFFREHRNGNFERFDKQNRSCLLLVSSDVTLKVQSEKQNDIWVELI